MRQKLSARINFKGHVAVVPQELFAVADKYKATLEDAIKEERGVYYTTAKIVDVSALTWVNFVRDAGKVASVDNIVFQEYTPRLIERIFDYFNHRT